MRRLGTPAVRTPSSTTNGHEYTSCETPESACRVPAVQSSALALWGNNRTWSMYMSHPNLTIDASRAVDHHPIIHLQLGDGRGLSAGIASSLTSAVPLLLNQLLLIVAVNRKLKGRHRDGELPHYDI
eukprot:UN0623